MTKLDKAEYHASCHAGVKLLKNESIFEVFEVLANKVSFLNLIKAASAKSIQ